MQMLSLPKLTAFILAGLSHPPGGARLKPPLGTAGNEVCLQNPAINFPPVFCCVRRSLTAAAKSTPPVIPHLCPFDEDRHGTL